MNPPPSAASPVSCSAHSSLAHFTSFTQNCCCRNAMKSAPTWPRVSGNFSPDRCLCHTFLIPSPDRALRHVQGHRFRLHSANVMHRHTCRTLRCFMRNLCRKCRWSLSPCRAKVLHSSKPGASTEIRCLQSAPRHAHGSTPTMQADASLLAVCQKLVICMPTSGLAGRCGLCVEAAIGGYRHVAVLYHAVPLFLRQTTGNRFSRFATSS